MGKFITIVGFITFYTMYCVNTQPSQCHTPKFFVSCQFIVWGGGNPLRTIAWENYQSIRVIK
jgi:hypothetical protein